MKNLKEIKVICSVIGRHYVYSNGIRFNKDSIGGDTLACIEIGRDIPQEYFKEVGGDYASFMDYSIENKLLKIIDGELWSIHTSDAIPFYNKGDKFHFYGYVVEGLLFKSKPEITGLYDGKITALNGDWKPFCSME